TIGEYPVGEFICRFAPKHRSRKSTRAVAPATIVIDPITLLRQGPSTAKATTAASARSTQPNQASSGVPAAHHGMRLARWLATGKAAAARATTRVTDSTNLRLLRWPAL